jgi:hypothetical protein
MIGPGTVGNEEIKIDISKLHAVYISVLRVT